MSTVTSEVVCAECRGEAATRAESHSLNGPRAQRYRDLEFKVVGEQEFRVYDDKHPDMDLAMLVLDAVESKLNLEFQEHQEGNGSILIYWRPAA